MSTARSGLIVPDDLSPERGLLFRITHIDNLPWLLANGIPCANGPKDPNFVAIGNANLIDKRSNRLVPKPPGGTLAAYVPFYFTPRSPMLLNILTGYRGITKRQSSDIVTLVTTIPALIAQHLPFLFTDMHAYLDTATYSADPKELPNMIDWDILRRADFARSSDTGKIERYQAEALVHNHVPIAALTGIACNGGTTERRVETMVQSAKLALRIAIRPGWYFQ